MGMSAAPVILGCLWLIAANIAAILPSRDNHWRRAYGLMATGAPLLVWLAVTQGLAIAALFALAAASVLRWPLVYLLKRIKRLLGR